MYPYTTAGMPRCDNATLLYDLLELHLDKIQYDAIMCSRSVHLDVRSLSFPFHLISSSRKEHCPPEMAVRFAYRRSNTGRSLTPTHAHPPTPRTVPDDKPPPSVYQSASVTATSHHHQMDRRIFGGRRVLFALSFRLSALSDTDRRAPILLSLSNLLSTRRIRCWQFHEISHRYPRPQQTALS